MHTLIVIEETRLQGMVKRVLDEEGHLTDVAENMGDGITRTLSNSYEMIIIDGSVFDVVTLKIFAKLCSAKLIKLLVLNDSGNLEFLLSKMGLSRESLVIKPYDSKEVSARIRAMRWSQSILHSEPILTT